MPKQNPEAVTKEFLVEQFQVFEKRFDEKLERKSKILESKIEFARKDMREHVASTIKSETAELSKKMDGLGQQMNTLELKTEALHDNIKYLWSDVKEIKQKLDVVVEKVDRHDEEITFLKSAVTSN